MALVKKYVGYIWIGADPGIRLSILAESGEEAMAKVRGQYGEDHVVSLWNEEDASRPRSVTPDVVARYIPLLDAFVNGRIAAEPFQEKFLVLWRDDRDSGRATGPVLDNLMTGVDCYAEDPDVLYGIDSEQLRVEARRALDLLHSGMVLDAVGPTRGLDRLVRARRWPPDRHAGAALPFAGLNV